MKAFIVLIINILCINYFHIRKFGSWVLAVSI